MIRGWEQIRQRVVPFDRPVILRTQGSSGALTISVSRTKPAVHITISALMRCRHHSKCQSPTAMVNHPACLNHHTTAFARSACRSTGSRGEQADPEA